jgi:hypothetical protein
MCVFLMLMHPVTYLWFQLTNVFSLAFVCSLLQMAASK